MGKGPEAWEAINKEMEKKGLDRSKVTRDLIESKIMKAEYQMLSSGKTLICELTLENGFTVRGESCVVCPENFDREIGERISYNDAFDKVGAFEAYLLQEKLYQETKKELE